MRSLAIGEQFHSTNDPELPVNNGDTVCPQAEAVGIACELVAYDGARHVVRRRDVIRRGLDVVAEQVLEPAGHLDEAPG